MLMRPILMDIDQFLMTGFHLTRILFMMSMILVGGNPEWLGCD
jgi:hypothetical protein